MTAVKIGVISQDGTSSTCAQRYYTIDPDSCTCKSAGCPASSAGSDPQVNEFGTNAISTSTHDGSYVFIDEYWHYIQQIYPNGTQITPPKAMIEQHCMADTVQPKVYRILAMQYDLPRNILFGLVLVPNQKTQTYDSKIVQIDIKSGACTDKVSGIEGSAVKWPDTCCGESNTPAYDSSTSTFYAFGPNGFKEYPNRQTLLAVNIDANTHSFGFLSDRIYTGYGFLFFDVNLGLFALGYENREFGLYRLKTPWKSNEIIEDELVLPLGKPLPSGSVYDPNGQKLYMVFEEAPTLATVDMKLLKLSVCNMPATCAGNIWQFPVLIN